MGSVIAALIAGLLCIGAQLAALPQARVSVAGMLMLVLPPIAVVYVLLTFSRFHRVAR